MFRLVFVSGQIMEKDYHLFAVNIDGSNQKITNYFDGVKVDISNL